MNTDTTHGGGTTASASAFLLAEYKELRAEILKRSEIQHQLVSFALAAMGALMTVGLRDSPPALLVYPIVTLGLAIGWTYNDMQIAQLGLYIRHRIERALVGNLGWEQTIATQIQSKEIGHLVKLATRGVFWSSAVLTLLLYLSKRTKPWPATLDAWGIEDFLLVLSIAATLYMFYVMGSRDKGVKKIADQMRGDPPQSSA
jgi:hypothetical protein